jgi:hypothetical protein
MAKVIFFTADNVPTVGELADIANLNARAVAPYEIAVRNTKVAARYGAGIEACDFVAGTVPVAFNAKPVIDPDAIPATGLTALQAVVTHNVDIVTPVTGVYATKIKATVVAGVITGFVLS